MSMENIEILGYFIMFIIEFVFCVTIGIVAIDRYKGWRNYK